MNDPLSQDPVRGQSSSDARSSPTTYRVTYGIFGLAALAFVLSLAGAGYWLASQPQGSGIEMIIPTVQPPVPVVVHVSGSVVSPGLYTLPPGSRIADAISKAGGFTSSGDPARLNLAAVLVDGQKVVASERDSPEVASPDPISPVAGLLDLNRATAGQLESLPGIGPSRASLIIEWRTQHGQIERVDELLEISGIGPATVDAIRDLVAQ